MKNNFLRTIFAAVFSINICLALHAQNVEELSAKYPNDYAVILNRSKIMTISLKDGQPVAETKFETRILVLDDKANGSYSKYSVYHGSFNDVYDIEAFTKISDSRKAGKIKVTEFKTENARSRSVFYDDVKETSFDFPSFTKGAEAFVSYSETEKDLHLLSPFYFVSYMPVLHETFTVVFPADMEIKYILKNDSAHVIHIREDKKGRQRIYEFSADDIRQGDRFANAPSYSYYEPHVIVQLASYKNENGDQVKYLGNVDDLYRWYYSFVDKLENTKDEILKKLSDSLTAGISSSSEKARNIYHWVQQNIKYVAFESGMEGFVPRRAADVCNRRYGDCKDMSSLLTALLQLAGLKAYFTWIGTRDIPYDYTDVSLPVTDNHMIAALDLDKEWIFLDGTDPNCIFGMPSSAIQGKQALIALSEKEYKILRVPEIAAEKNIVTDSTFISLADNGIKGNSSVYYAGYFGTDLSDNLLYRDGKDTRDYVKYKMGKASNKFILGGYNITTINSNEKLMNIRADFEVPDYSKKIADELYINLNLEKFFTNSIIDTAKRKVPVENDYKYVIKQYTILDVPADYKVSYVPKDYSYNNDNFGFAIQYTQQEDKIIAAQEIRNNCLLMKPGDFNTWNIAVKQLINQYKEQVVLEKKETNHLP